MVTGEQAFRQQNEGHELRSHTAKVGKDSSWEHTGIKERASALRLAGSQALNGGRSKKKCEKKQLSLRRNDKTCWDKTLEEAQAGFTDEKRTGGRHRRRDTARVQSQKQSGKPDSTEQGRG